MLLPAFLARKWLLWAALLVIAGCQFPHYDFPANGGDKSDASTAGAGGGATGSGGSSGADAMPAMRNCTSATDCADASEGIFCDTGRGKCVQCMGNADCAPGFSCNEERCVSCFTDKDCRRVDADGSAADGEADDAGDGGAGASGGRLLWCGPMSQKCTGCAADLDCPLGTVCDTVSTLCVAGCTATQRCPEGFWCCDKTCISTDRECSPTCAPGTADCNQIKADGCETKLNTSEHCGDCDTSCGRPHQATTCVASSCMTGKCDEGFLDCDGWPNGCEVDGMSDLNHCGACTTRCENQHGQRNCVAGVCSPTCEPNFAVCDKNPADGCTVDLMMDPLNCGACGHACKGGPCVNGVCTICPDEKLANNTQCNDSAIICGPYGWVGSMDRLCFCFCVNSKITCRINNPDGDGC